MKRTLILTFILTTSLCFGQKEHLEPANGFNPNDSARYGRSYSKLKEYHNVVHTLLYSGFSQKPYARYTSMPSFSSEYAFSVEEIRGKFYIISNIFSENYWYAGYKNKRNSVKINTIKTEINNDLYLKIGELFELLVKQTKEKERKFEVEPNGEIYELISIGADGTTYSFTITDKNGEIKTGTTWSPHPSDKPMLSRLVKICDDLCSVEIENYNSQSNILEEIDKLTDDLRR